MDIAGLHFAPTGIELFWMFVTYTGFAMMLGFFFETRGDRAEIKRKKINGAMKIVAEAGIRRQGAKLLMSFVLAVPATVAALTEQPIPEGWRALNIICLSLIPVLLLIVNLVDRTERAALTDYYDNQTDNEIRVEAEDRITERA